MPSFCFFVAKFCLNFDYLAALRILQYSNKYKTTQMFFPKCLLPSFPIYQKAYTSRWERNGVWCLILSSNLPQNQSSLTTLDKSDRQLQVSITWEKLTHIQFVRQKHRISVGKSEKTGCTFPYFWNFFSKFCWNKLHILGCLL